MNLRKLSPYVLQGLVVGIVGGFIFLMLLKPETPPGRPVVTFREAETPRAGLGSEATGVVSYAAAVEAAAPSVVNVYTTKIVRPERHPLFSDPLLRRFFGDSPQTAPRERLQNSLGSGVIVSADGFVLTNNHVIADADEILVALRDGRSTQAEVVGTDPETDIAVLRIPPDNLQSIVIGSSDTLRIGDVVLAIGNPFGVGQTVTMGIVSATGRSQLGISTFENFIQTDAAINPGNSGGALIDALGNLVGINTAIFSRTGGSQGIGFAIPVSLAKTVMQQIIEHGRAIRGWLGIEVQDITPDLAESFGLANTSGVLVAGVLANGPAASAGLQPGDVVTQVNDRAIDNGNQLINTIAAIAPGTEVELKLLRSGAAMKLKAKVGERPKPR